MIKKIKRMSVSRGVLKPSPCSLNGPNCNWNEWVMIFGKIMG